MKYFRKNLYAIGLLFGVLVRVLGQDPNELLKTDVISEVSALKPGDSAWIGVTFVLKPGWHIYWKNSGESGYPTSIEWESGDAEFGPLKFPTPRNYQLMEMISYVHEDTVALLTRMTLNEEVQAGERVQVSGKLSTLVCNEENCIPFDKELKFEILSANATKYSSFEVQKINGFKNHWPVEPPSDTKLSLLVKGEAVTLSVEHPKLKNLEADKFFFFPESTFFGHIEEQRFEISKDNFSVKVTLPRSVEDPPPLFLSGVLSHPKLDSGWDLKWSLQSSSYGESDEELSGTLSSPGTPLANDMDLNSLWLMLGLVTIAFGGWLYGKSTSAIHSSRIRQRYGLGALLFIGLGIWLGFPTEEEIEEGEIVWAEWSPEIQAKLLEQGRAVYVDYTAKWCASCLANKRVYQYENIKTLFEEKEIVALRADWTDRGPIIHESLQSFGREGVPLNVYYPPVAENGMDVKSLILPELLTSSNLSEAIEDGRVFQQEAKDGFWAILGFAFVGGVILNLMPCVFPVIGLKIMSFVKQAGENPKQIKIHGLLFTLGVILSFWLLVGTLLYLRETIGEDLGWGFQLQEPIFVFILAVFLLLFAMSLSGIFELGLSLTGVGSKLTQTGGLSSSFFSGVLATVVATPCMAPFLGVAVGAALTMEWFPAFIVFTFVALGLSAPYLILSVFPKWISRLPKPGAWMETFKQAMAFPLYGTVAWLLWTLQSLL